MPSLHGLPHRLIVRLAARLQHYAEHLPHLTHDHELLRRGQQTVVQEIVEAHGVHEQGLVYLGDVFRRNLFAYKLVLLNAIRMHG